jgi:hypothetical protein
MALPSFLTPSTWHVVASPVVALGGALLAGGALLLAQVPATSSLATPTAAYRLTLHTESARACYYGSAWNEGDVLLAHDAADGHVVTLSGRYDFEDGCTWEATEVLTPAGNGYAYSYSERPVRCAIGATPAPACGRVGTVDVAPAE